MTEYVTRRIESKTLADSADAAGSARLGRASCALDSAMVDLQTARLSDWSSFYVVVGSSGAALIGLQFIVITLIAEMRIPSTHEQIRAFATPTIMHFGAALLVSTLLSAPWRSLTGVAIALRVIAVFGIVYAVLTLWRARSQHDYEPVWQDWLWHGVIPIIIYGALLAAAIFIRTHESDALFVIAGVALSLLLTGIRNAWDTVLYIVLDRSRQPNV
jgi:hypothetical protein